MGLEMKASVCRAAVEILEDLHEVEQEMSEKPVQDEDDEG